MFDRIAGVYDLMNTTMTVGMHHRWRERAADRAELQPGGTALDLCCGTGDLALELTRRVGPDGAVVGCDFSEPMLELARRKAAKRGAEAGPVRVGRRSGASLPGGVVRRRHGGLRGAQPGRPRSRAGRDGPGAEARRPLRDPRDHPAAPAPPVDLLLAVVRPDRAAAGRSRGGPRRLHVPARVGEALPVARGPGGDDGGRRFGADLLPAAGRRDHRDPLRRQGGRAGHAVESGEPR